MAGLGPSLLRSAVLVRQLHAVPGFAEHGVRLRSCAIVDTLTCNKRPQSHRATATEPEDLR